jgi:hypothetical protein
METPTPRWSLLDTSTNRHGVTHFTLICRDVDCPDGDYEELMRTLQRDFGAVEEGQLVGPYSLHKYLEVEGLHFGLILDDPDELVLYVRDKRDVPAMELFVAKLLEALNYQKRT